MLNRFLKRSATSPISVIMPTYNRQTFLQDAIESILNQTFVCFELIIINDFSTDNTAEIIMKYRKQDNRIVIITNEANMGTAHCYKQGISIAKGRYIACMDDDNVSSSERLEKQIMYLQQNPSIAILGSYVSFIGNTDKKLNLIKATKYSEIETLLNFYNPTCNSTLMMQKDILQKHNITYNSSLPYSYDYYLINSAIENKLRVENLPEELLQYRCHPNQLSNNEKYTKCRKYAIDDIQYYMLKKFFSSNDELYYVKQLLSGFPLENYDINNVRKALSIILDKNEKLHLLNSEYLYKIAYGNLF